MNKPQLYKKGQSGNPSGRPKQDPMIREFKEMTFVDFVEKLKLYGSLTKKEMKIVTEDKRTSVLDLIYCRHLWDAMNGRDKARDSLYERLWGKVKEPDITVEQFSAEHELMRRIPVIELIGLARKYIQPPQEDPHDV